MPFAEGGTVSGAGKIIRKDGTVVEFELQSDPLTKAQAESLNQAEGKDDGRHSSNNRS